MKKIVLPIVLFSFCCAYADEGMWLPHLLGQQKYAEMKAKGLKLTADQIYHINKPSVKDAIVLFGTGCSGEIVSAEGMLFTNFHCAYEQISNLSTKEHNYVKNGFYAKSKSEEIPVPGLWVMFLVKVEDVSKQVEDSMKSYPNWSDWTAKRAGVFEQINSAAVEGTSYKAFVYSMFNDNQFLLYTYEQYNDIRLVGTPPESIGNFGGESDNWEWPRHSGDFAIFRVYMNKDGGPSGYDAANIPLKSKYFLPISLKGIKDNDFTMTMGYPGNTIRYETSYAVRLATDISNPALVRMRDIRLQAMMDEMKKDVAVKSKLSASYADLANYWKYYEGETKQLLQYKVYESKKKQEDAVTVWLANKPAYANLFANYERAYSAWVPFARHKEYYEQGISGSAVIKLANRMEPLERLLLDNGSKAEIKKNTAMLDSLRTVMLNHVNRTAEQQMLWQLAKAFQGNIAGDQQPVLFYNLIKQNYGTLNDDETYKLWVASLFANSIIWDDAKWKAFILQPDPGTLQRDPVYNAAFAFRENWKKFRPQLLAFTQTVAQLNHLYLKATREMNAGKQMYPDANTSMRLSYGNVKGYKPRDGVLYESICTAKGLLEKYKAGDEEFDIPAAQLKLLQSRDYGKYADPVLKELVVSFVSTDDQTGGSSGSPVLNANGELIGISYDANYESLSNRYVYDKNYTRVVNLDIRYMLWCIDKLAGAENIMKELKIVTTAAR